MLLKTSPIILTLEITHLLSSVMSNDVEDGEGFRSNFLLDSPYNSFSISPAPSPGCLMPEGVNTISEPPKHIEVITLSSDSEDECQSKDNGYIPLPLVKPKRKRCHNY